MNPFEYNGAPSPAMVDKMARVRQAASALADVVLETMPHTRERSLALTNIEQAAMWANKGIAHGDPS